MRIYTDIETAPTFDPAVIAEIRAAIKPPGNISKPETAAAWMKEKGEQAALEAIGKTALSPEDGSIIAIGVALDDDNPPVVFVKDKNAETDAYVILDALSYVEDVLIDASHYSSTEPGKAIFTPTPWWVGHNVAGFDLPFLWKRLAVNDLQPPIKLPAPDEIRHGKNCYDTQTAWAGHKGFIGLSRLCRVLGIPDPKQNQDGITGANAWEFWQRGDLETVKSYCRGDVEAVRAVYRRIESVGGLS